MARLLKVAMVVLLPVLVAADGPASRATSRPATRATSRPVRGEILALTETTITAVPFMPRSRNSPMGTAPETYDLKPYTRYFKSKPTTQRTSPTGQIAISFDMMPATREDVKVGLIARINADGPTALEVVLLPEDLRTMMQTTRPSTRAVRRSTTRRVEGF